MRILLYTVSDFSPYAEKCIKLLFGNIIPESNVDFCVITNGTPPSKFEYNTIKVDLDVNFTGILKFYPCLPKYDAYVFLDTDILYFERTSKLINDQNDYTIVRDNDRMIIDQWCSYHITDKSILNKDICGLNSGTFAFVDTKFLEDITEIIQRYYSSNNTPRVNAKYEQSAYNIFMGEKCGYDWKKYYDITDSVKLFATHDTLLQENINLYHFCGGNTAGKFNGWHGHMFHKYRKMCSFIKKNNI